MPQVNIRIEAVKDEEQQTGAPTQKASDKKEGGAKQSLGTIFTHQLMNTTKTIVMSSINNISNFTGNYQLQESVQNTVEDVMSVVGIGVAFAVNPVLGAFSLASKITSTVLQEKTNRRNELHAQYQANYLRERSGNTLDNGSRTGE